MIQKRDTETHSGTHTSMSVNILKLHLNHHIATYGIMTIRTHACILGNNQRLTFNIPNTILPHNHNYTCLLSDIIVSSK